MWSQVIRQLDTHSLLLMDIHERRLLFGHNVRDIRESQDLSQRRLAAMINSNQSYLWEIETGRTSVGFDIICRIADALDVSERDLFDWSRQPQATIEYLPRD